MLVQTKLGMQSGPAFLQNSTLYTDAEKKGYTIE